MRNYKCQYCDRWFTYEEVVDNGNWSSNCRPCADLEAFLGKDRLLLLVDIVKARIDDHCDRFKHEYDGDY